MLWLEREGLENWLTKNYCQFLHTKKHPHHQYSNISINIVPVRVVLCKLQYSRLHGICQYPFHAYMVDLYHLCIYMVDPIVIVMASGGGFRNRRGAHMAYSIEHTTLLIIHYLIIYAVLLTYIIFWRSGTYIVGLRFGATFRYFKYRSLFALRRNVGPTSTWEWIWEAWEQPLCFDSSKL